MKRNLAAGMKANMGIVKNIVSYFLVQKLRVQNHLTPIKLFSPAF